MVGPKYPAISDGQKRTEKKWSKPLAELLLVKSNYKAV